MKGLLLKDYYILKRQLLMFLVLIAFFSIFSSSFGIIYACVFAAVLPITTIAYDERSHWEKLAAAMPYSAKQLVWSKYLSGILMMVSFVALTLVLQAAVGAVKHTAIPSDTAVLCLCSAAGALIMQALLLPVIFKMGVEKTRLFYMIVVVAAILVAMHFVSINQISRQNFVVTVQTALLVFAASAALSLLSAVLSERIYAKKES